MSNAKQLHVIGEAVLDELLAIVLGMLMTKKVGKASAAPERVPCSQWNGRGGRCSDALTWNLRTARHHSTPSASTRAPRAPRCGRASQAPPELDMEMASCTEEPSEPVKSPKTASSGDGNVGSPRGGFVTEWRYADHGVTRG